MGAEVRPDIRLPPIVLGLDSSGSTSMEKFGEPWRLRWRGTFLDVDDSEEACTKEGSRRRASSMPALSKRERNQKKEDFEWEREYVHDLGVRLESHIFSSNPVHKPELEVGCGRTRLSASNFSSAPLPLVKLKEGGTSPKSHAKATFQILDCLFSEQEDDDSDDSAPSFPNRRPIDGTQLNAPISQLPLQVGSLRGHFQAPPDAGTSGNTSSISSRNYFASGDRTFGGSDPIPSLAGSDPIDTFRLRPSLETSFESEGTRAPVGTLFTMSAAFYATPKPPNRDRVDPRKYPDAWRPDAPPLPDSLWVDPALRWRPFEAGAEDPRVAQRFDPGDRLSAPPFAPHRFPMEHDSRLNEGNAGELRHELAVPPFAPFMREAEPRLRTSGLDCSGIVDEARPSKAFHSGFTRAAPMQSDTRMQAMCPDESLDGMFASRPPFPGFLGDGSPIGNRRPQPGRFDYGYPAEARARPDDWYDLEGGHYAPYHHREEVRLGLGTNCNRGQRNQYGQGNLPSYSSERCEWHPHQQLVHDGERPMRRQFNQPFSNNAEGFWRPQQQEEAMNDSGTDEGLFQQGFASTAWPNEGSIGHPEVCSHPCSFHASGNCEHGSRCSYCHMPHPRRQVHLDKRNREVLKSMTYGQVFDMILPLLREKSRRMGFAHALPELLAAIAPTEEDAFDLGPDGPNRRPRSAPKQMRTLSCLRFGELVCILSGHAGAPQRVKGWGTVRNVLGTIRAKVA